MESIEKIILHCLKQIPEDDIRIENQPPDPCYLCDEQICSNTLKSHITLSFHRSCLERTLVTKTNYPICGNDFNDIETTEDSSGENLSQSSGTSSITRMLEKNLQIDSNNVLQGIPENESINEFQDEIMTNVSIDDTSVTPRKRAKNHSSTDKPPKKKTKKNGERISIFIQELSTAVDEHPPEVLKEREDCNDLYNLYVKISNAERDKGRANQEVIRCYYFFGKALWGRFEEHRLLHLEHEAQKMVNEEVRQQLTDVSNDVLKKTTQLGRRIYEIFSRIGEDKISRVKTFGVWEILKLRNKEVEHVICEVLRR